jgi:UDP-N-acetylmuramate dehydrogenase
VPLFLPHFNLQKLNTLAVPAIADYFVAVHNDSELREALAFSRTENLPHLLLGGGSNIVLQSDFPGVVIQLKSQGKELIAEDENFVWLKVSAGENWHQLVEYTLAEGFYGLENLSLIPGSVGAAPIQNIGAYGVEVKDLISELTALEIRSGLTVNFTNESCRFGYRDSIFKHTLKDQYVITSVTFCLAKTPRPNLSYPALQHALAGVEKPTPQAISDAVIAIRSEKLPDPALIPNVGSFFKNPIISTGQLSVLRSKYPDIVSYAVNEDSAKLAAAWLIDRAGWRGKTADGAQVHVQQALVLTNPQHLYGSAVLALAKRVQDSVYAEFGVSLEMEPRVYP